MLRKWIKKTLVRPQKKYLRPTQNEAKPNLYSQYKDQAHVFIFSVCGRTSSTALQRILNSTDEILIWGESSGIFEKMVTHLNHLENAHQKYPKVGQKHHKLLVDAFNKKDHTSWYPKATKNLEALISQQYELLCKQLIPPMDHIDRFGFKEIGVYDEAFLPFLGKIFSQSSFIFLFRNPIEQWISVRESGYFSYSKELPLFLSFYEKFATKYLTYFKKHDHGLFVHNQILYSQTHVQQMIEKLELQGFDDKLISNIVHSFQNGELSDEEKEMILNSNAYQLFLVMQKLSNHFFNSDE